MTIEQPPPGPHPEDITRTIVERYPATDVVTIPGATFFSLDGEKHWPNFATIVETDDFDEGAPSRLTDRIEVFRLNLGVGRETFERLVIDGVDHDYAAFDRLLPHPVYAKQRWISILNPSEATFRNVVLPLLDEAHGRVAEVQARHATPAEQATHETS